MSATKLNLQVLGRAMSSSLSFTVERSEPELIPPAKPTPYELKALSDVDAQKCLRVQSNTILFYRNNMGMQGRDPVKVIKEAIGKALVYYYPFAGRLREGPNEKLMVECTGEGVLFVEADADVRLDQFGDVPQPPFPGVESLFHDVPGTADILHCPLFLIQVTRLICGGFTLVLRRNHAMADANGAASFLKAVGEIACGSDIPSVEPVWRRELLNARDPPQVSSVARHMSYGDVEETKASPVIGQMAQRSFFFGPQEIKSLRSQLPPPLQMSTKFEILTACIWRCHTMALYPNSNDSVGIGFLVNARSRFNPPLPVGFYGNGIGIQLGESSVSKLCQNPLGYAVDIIKRAKVDATEEFIRSSIDLLVQKGQPTFTMTIPTFSVTDHTRIGFNDVDFGWGRPVYSGPMHANPLCSYYLSWKNNNGEDGILVPVALPEPSMERFSMEIHKMISNSTVTPPDPQQANPN